MSEAERGAINVRAEFRSLAEDEFVRQRIRDEIANQNKPKPSLWTFLNSSFALWFLSSVALSGIVFVYSEYDEVRSEQRKSAARISALKDEIGYRLDSDLVKKIFDASGQGGEPPKTFHVAVLCLPSDQFGAPRDLGGLPAPNSLGAVSLPTNISNSENIEKSLLAGRFIHTEFRDRSIFSLIWELQKREKDPAQVKLIADALSAISELRRDALSGAGSKSAVSYLMPVETLIASWKS